MSCDSATLRLNSFVHYRYSRGRKDSDALFDAHRSPSAIAVDFINHMSTDIIATMCVDVAVAIDSSCSWRADHEDPRSSNTLTWMLPTGYVCHYHLAPHTHPGSL